MLLAGEAYQSLLCFLPHFSSQCVGSSLLFCDKFSTHPTVRKLLSATVRKGVAGKFYWIGSDSWGAKIHPVRDQEWAAEGAITILPKRNSIEGNPPSSLHHSCQLGRKEKWCKLFSSINLYIVLGECSNFFSMKQNEEWEFSFARLSPQC